MSPHIAILLFVGFIFWIVRRDSKEATGVSHALWVPVIWVGIDASRPVGYWFNSTSVATDPLAAMEGSPFDRNVYLALIILGIIILVRRRIDWSSIIKLNRALIIFHLYLLISVLWSDYPLVSFKRWVKDFGTVVMILIVLTEGNPYNAIKRIFSMCTYALIPLSLLFVKYYSEIGRYYDRYEGHAYYCGITMNKNALGVLAMVSGIFLIWRLSVIWKLMPSRQRSIGILANAVVLVMCIWLLDIARSATSIACFAIATTVFIASHFKWMQTNIRQIAFYAGSLTLLSLIILITPDLRELVVKSLGRDVTLTGRTVIWDMVLSRNTNPLIGTGFGAFWVGPDAVQISQNWALTEAHNGYLETYLNSGLIGVVLLFGVLFSAGKNAIRHLATGTGLGNFYLALFLSGIIYNYTEATFNVSHIMGFCLWLIAFRITPIQEPALGDGGEIADTSRALLQTATFDSGHVCFKSLARAMF
ncbi:MAG TPA: O-antigen ligase family protein [Candidatus Limnocylindrales bacterium]|nr:O-antigen ligase family protein [Candidatus Limnocylindrales bacterium]